MFEKPFDRSLNKVLTVRTLIRVTFSVVMSINLIPRPSKSPRYIRKEITGKLLKKVCIASYKHFLIYQCSRTHYHCREESVENTFKVKTKYRNL